MAENDDTNVTGVFRSFMSPAGYTQRAKADRTACDVHVPPAADSIIGHCEYYYRPLHCEFREKVEKLPSINEMVDWAKSFNPWSDGVVTKELLGKRDRLISPQCTDSDWSRHSNFMMRHVGCGHQPPSYYLSYGYYYCSNYGRYLMPALSEAGKGWLVMARKKLQENMEDGLHLNMIQDGIQMSSKAVGNGSFSMPEVKQYQLELDDDTFKSFAFNTHPLAYLDAGLANLPMTDLARIGGQPSIQEWEDKRTWNQAIDSGGVVLIKKGGDVVDAISDAVNTALQRLLAK